MAFPLVSPPAQVHGLRVQYHAGTEAPLKAHQVDNQGLLIVLAGEV